MHVCDVMQNITRIDPFAEFAVEEQFYGRADHVPGLALAERIHHVGKAQAAREAVQGAGGA